MFERLETKGIGLLTGFIYVWAEIIVTSLSLFCSLQKQGISYLSPLYLLACT